MAWPREFEVAFNPKAIAVVGVSARNPDVAQSMALGGVGFVRTLTRMGYSGHLYPINPHASELLGLKAYPNLVSVPEPVDLVIVCVPAPKVAEVLEDCIAANARNVHVFTAGFEETGEEEAKELLNLWFKWTCDEARENRESKE